MVKLGICRRISKTDFRTARGGLGESASDLTQLCIPHESSFLWLTVCLMGSTVMDSWKHTLHDQNSKGGIQVSSQEICCRTPGVQVPSVNRPSPHSVSISAQRGLWASAMPKCVSRAG